MVRRYDTQKAVPAAVVDQLVHNALQAPSAGFSQGIGLLVLDKPDDIARFRAAVTPAEKQENWYAATFDAPLVIVPCSDKDTYLDRYAQPDKGFTDRSDAWWPVPFWDIDTGFSALLVLLTAVDHGLGACFFGLPKERVDTFREAFGVPSRFKPIGAITIGYPTEPARDLSHRRRPKEDVIHKGHWSGSFAPK